MIENRLLIWKCKRGNQTAFRRIYEQYEGDLRTLAANLLDDKAVAEDVVHDVFISFLQAVNGFELKIILAGYLKTSVANRARDYMQKKKPKAVSSNEFQNIVSHGEKRQKGGQLSCNLGKIPNR